MNSTQPAAGKERTLVCLACGSIEVSAPAPDCAHPRVAAFDAIPSGVANVLIKLRAAKRYVAFALATVEDGANIERSAGRGEILDLRGEPGSNVVRFTGMRRIVPAREDPLELACRPAPRQK